MDINQILSQLQPAATLYSEILISMAAASLLGLLVGLMMQRANHKRALSGTIAKWEERYKTLDDTGRSDTESLEERLQLLAKDTKSLQATNQALRDTLKKNDINMQQSRAEAIELNRQHTETHERLQRIIQQKDREIVELGNRLNQNPLNERPAGSTHIAPDTVANEATLNLNDIPENSDSDLNYADTVAIAPGQGLADVLDATVQMAFNPALSKSNISGASSETDALDESLDDTSDMSEIGLEESTIAMDEEALSFARQSSKGGSAD